MARAGVTYLEVAKAAEAIQHHRQNPTVDRVLAHLGTGSKSTLAPLLKRWKLENEGKTDSVGLPDEILKTVKTVHERLQQIADDKIKQAENACLSTVTALQEQANQAEHKTKELEKHHQDLQKRLKAQQTGNRSLRTELEKEHIKTAKLEEALSQTTARLSDAKATLEEQKQENKHIRSHFEHYQTSVANDRQQAREQSHAIKVQLEARIQEHSQQLKNAGTRQQQLAIEKDQSEQALMQQREKYAQLKQQHQTFKQEAQQYKTSIKHLKKEARNLNQERIASEKHEQTSAKKIIELTSTAHGLEQELTRLNQQLLEVTDTATRLTDENNFICQEKAHLQGQLKQLERRG